MRIDNPNIELWRLLIMLGCDGADPNICWVDHSKVSRPIVNYCGRNTSVARLICYLRAREGNTFLDLDDLSGWEACHNCNNNRCINPDHLRADSRESNLEDRRRYNAHKKIVTRLRKKSEKIAIRDIRDPQAVYDEILKDYLDKEARGEPYVWSESEPDECPKCGTPLRPGYVACLDSCGFDPEREEE